MIVTEIDKYKRGWISGRPETSCGLGSRVAETETQRAWIPEMVGKYGIHTIADIGAGDLNWIKLVQWPHPVQYSPYDLVPRRKDVQPFDLIHEIPRKSDLLMCLWVLNHLPENHARLALANLLASGSKYLMITYWPGMADFLQLEPIESVVIRAHKKADIRLIKC
jgi:hypothetical protein